MLLAVNTASAANTQGLTWAFSPGDRIDYTYRIDFGDTTYPYSILEGTYECYVIIDTLPEISEVVGIIPTITNMNVDQYLANGTEFYFLWIAVPIGNWTLLTELLENSMGSSTNVTLINTFTEWGYDQSYSYGGTQQNTVLRIAKSDGAIQYLKQEMIYTDETHNTLIELTRVGGSFLPIDDTLLIPIGIGAVAVIIILAVLVKRR